MENYRVKVNEDYLEHGVIGDFFKNVSYNKQSYTELSNKKSQLNNEINLLRQDNKFTTQQLQAYATRKRTLESEVNKLTNLFESGSKALQIAKENYDTRKSQYEINKTNKMKAEKELSDASRQYNSLLRHKESNDKAIENKTNEIKLLNNAMSKKEADYKTEQRAANQPIMITKKSSTNDFDASGKSKGGFRGKR